MFIMKIIYWILMVLAWYYMVKNRRNVKSWTGNFVWAERYIGNWWTYIVIILLWIWLMLVWVLYPLWIINLSSWIKTDNQEIMNK